MTDERAERPEAHWTLEGAVESIKGVRRLGAVLARPLDPTLVDARDAAQQRLHVADARAAASGDRELERVIAVSRQLILPFGLVGLAH